MFKLKPKVTVIVPVYGVENYIERCARSLFEQTLDDIEYVFIDDCTPDRSMDILRSVLSDYPSRINQVIYHRMDCNSGLAKVRSWGLQHSNGEYTITCDSDDWVDHDLYRSMYEKAMEIKADVVVCDYQYHNGDDAIIVKRGYLEGNSIKFQRDLLTQRMEWAIWNKMFRTDLLKRIVYFPNCSMGEDMLLTMQILSNCDTIAAVHDKYYYYYQNPCSIVHSSGITPVDRYQQVQDNFIRLVRYYSEVGLYDLYRKELDCVRYSIRRFLFVPIAECRRVRKKVYPWIELKIIFNSSASLTMKKRAIREFFLQLMGQI